MLSQQIRTARRQTYFKFADGLRVQSAFFQIIFHKLRLGKIFLKKILCRVRNIIKRVMGMQIPVAEYFQIHSGFFRQNLQRVIKFQIFILHQKLDNITALIASSKTMPRLPFRRNHKRRRFFFMEWTARFEVFTGRL